MTEKDKQRFLRSKDVSDEGSNDIEIAFISLRTALKSFFSLYSIFSFPINPDDPTRFKKNEYYEIYTETILHLHHYFELIIKDILRKENPLLTVRLERIDEPETLLNIINGKKLDDHVLGKMQTMEFAKSLKILLKLIKKEEYEKYSFFQDFDTTLNLLTTLRNKIWHRGLFVLDFKSFVELVIDHILPIVILIGNDEAYENYDNWKPIISYKYTNILDVLVKEKSKSKFL